MTPRACARSSPPLSSERIAQMFPDTFQTARLTLRSIAMEDAGPIFEGWAQDTDVTRFLIWQPHQDRSETEVYIGRCVASAPDTSRTYVMIGRDDLTIRGALDLRRASLHR